MLGKDKGGPIVKGKPATPWSFVMTKEKGGTAPTSQSVVKPNRSEPVVQQSVVILLPKGVHKSGFLNDVMEITAPNIPGNPNLMSCFGETIGVCNRSMSSWNSSRIPG